MDENQIKYEKKKDLIELINSEINLIAFEQKRPGWTAWALLAGLFTVFWLLINEMSPGRVNFYNVLFIFLFFSLLMETVLAAGSLFSIKANKEPTEPRFYLSSSYSESRITILFQVIRLITLIYICVHLKFQVIRVSVISFYIIFIFLLFGYVLILILSYLKLPQPKFANLKIQLFTALIIFVLLFISTIGFTSTLIKIFGTLDSVDFRIGALLTIMVYILNLLLRTPQNVPLLASLIEIRRDLFLDKIDVEFANRQIDIALAGLQVEDLLQENVREILSYQDIINSKLRQNIRIIETIENLFPANLKDLQKKELSDLRETVLALRVSSDNYFEECGSLLDALECCIEKFNKRTRWIKSIDKRAKNKINVVVEKFNIGFSEINKQLDNVKEKVHATVSKVQNVGKDV